MKKIVPLGEFILLKEYEEEKKKGDLMLADGARGDRKFVVVEIGAEVDTELEKGDVVFVQERDLTPIKIDEKRRVFMVNYEHIMGYEEAA